MIIKQRGYIVVDGRNSMWLSTLSTNRHDAWGEALDGAGLTKKDLLEGGFKCVLVTITTDEFERKQ